MTHEMQLTPVPFDMIRDGSKKVELRLYDEKRREISVGDLIVFSNTETGEKLEVKVVDLYIFDSFKTLYEKLPLLECGYTKDDIDTASPDDMDIYYSKEKQAQYGVVGIRIEL